MTDLRQAAQQALEALESGLAFDTHSDVLQNLRTALEQQAEPVAWMDRDGDVYPMPENKKWAPPHVLLYTAPPQRQWVGLTDEDMKDPKTHILDFIYGARWAEAKLKERNHD